MNTAQLSQISDYLMVSASIVLALAFLSYLAEWAFARRVENAKELVAVGADQRSARTEDDVPSQSDVFGSIAVSLTALATGLLVLSVITRGLAAQRAPWGNMYEFGLTGVAFALVAYLIMVRIYDIAWLGAMVTGFGLAVLALAKSAYVPAGPLVPALDSYWLVIHVASVLLAGGLFLIGAAASVLFLIRSRAEERDKVGPLLARLPESGVMDQVAYRVNALAFPLWTFGTLIAGPIWAYEAWSRFWGWDPKEVWALITWIVYAGYLHARVTAGWKGKRAAWFCLIGFSTFLISFYVINLFVGGLHSYAK